MFTFGRCLAAVIGMAFALAGSPAVAEKRVALVIGNNGYPNLPADRQLANAINDARAVKTTLEALGFKVLYGENLDRRALIDKTFDLAAQLSAGDTAFFYFAGHGVSFSGANYLLPSDIPSPHTAGRAEEGRLADQAIAETQVIERITASGAGVTIVVLDACRDNPLQTADKRSLGSTRGLAQVQPARGVFSIYSAGIGQAALDRLGRDDRDPNSVFTRVFISQLKTPGIDLKTVATQTRRIVAELAEKAGQEQFPAYYDQIIGGDVYLAGLPAAPASGATQTPAVDPAAQAWAVTQNTTSVAVLEDFVRQFGSTAYGSMARARIEELRSKQVAVVAPPIVPPVSAAPCGGTAVTVSLSRAAAPLSAAEECSLKPKDTFKECDNCPEMVVVPAGAFTMGSPAGENGRFEDEGPQHVVTIRQPFAVGKFEVTVDQFAVFVKETGYDAGSICRTFAGGKAEDREGRSWRNPGFAHAGSHPAACLNWNDAKAYLGWLAKNTGKRYRLLTEAEYEYAIRARTTAGAAPRYFFGDDEASMCRYGNGADQTAKATIPGADEWTVLPCRDGFAYTAPVGSFSANGFGLYDMHGNLWSWTEDCYHDSYAGAPPDGSAWISGDCSSRVLRGGSWFSGPGILRSARRFRVTPIGRGINNGFRVGRTLLTL